MLVWMRATIFTISLAGVGWLHIRFRKTKPNGPIFTRPPQECRRGSRVSQCYKKKKTFTSRRICSKLPYFADILERRDEEDDTESIKKARRFYRACVDFGMLGVLHFYLLKSQCCKTSRCCKF